ncbi:hypothetical protein OEA41_009252, partial [Lepraria neglecta]
MNRHFPRTLTHISLSYITLPNPENFQLDRFDVLSHLELHECQNTGETLAGYEEPRLKHFTFRYSDLYSRILNYHLRDEDEEDFEPVPMEELIKFIYNFQSLNSLTVDLSSPAQDALIHKQLAP